MNSTAESDPASPDGAMDARPCATRRTRMRSLAMGSIIVAMTVAALLLLWWTWLWRTMPRTRLLPPVTGAVSTAPLKPVFGVSSLPPAPDPADALLAHPVTPLTTRAALAPNGDSRDYVSLSIYFWPNPVTGSRPYVHRDGRRNPEAMEYDAPRLRAVIDCVAGLAALYLGTGDRRCGMRAVEHVEAWFVNPETSMRPHFTYAQMMPGWAAGGRQGIIESIALTTVLPDAVAVLDAGGLLTPEQRRGLRTWFGSYLTWLLESAPGNAERRRPNNHGTWYDVQVVALATTLGLDDRAREHLLKSRRRMEGQFRADGQQPYELARTTSFEYSLYNLDAWFHLARLGRRHGVEIWTHRNVRGASPATGLDYLEDTIDTWPHPQLTPPSKQALERFHTRVDTWLNSAEPPSDDS